MDSSHTRIISNER